MVVESLEEATRLLSEGKASAAVAYLRSLTDLDLDGHLLMAEALWMEAGPGGSRESLRHYEAAEEAAAQDLPRLAAVSLGHGWALLKLNDVNAKSKLEAARALAEEDGNGAAVQFVKSLLESSESSNGDSTWDAFVKASVTDEAVVFMNGSIKEPLDERSSWGVMKLQEAGVKKLRVVNVSESELPGQRLSDSIELPQLYVKQREVKDWLTVRTAELRDLLMDAGVELEAQPCHGAFDGLEEWQAKLVELVARSGATDWDSKLNEVQNLKHSPQTTKALAEEWERLAPLVKEKLSDQPEMPCGHSCNTCPTKHDCQLHDAVGHTRDIEDLA